MPVPNRFTRRAFIQRATLASLAVGAPGALAACASSGGGDDTFEGEKSSSNPFGVQADAPLDVVIFKGGYGDDYAKFDEQLYSAQFPDAKISHAGITDIKQQLQPRFNAGDPPDVVDNAGAEAMPLSTLADTDQLSDLSDLFAADAIGFEGKTVEETLLPVAIESAMYDDVPMVLNYAQVVYGLWYDKALFEKRGWAPAETWDEFMALCEEIKKSGMAPMCHQGKYPYYIEQTLLDLAVKHGGNEVIYAIDSLEPEAWMNESVKMAAEALLEIKSKGYMLEGTEGLDHIQSQTAWNKGEAAFIPCGSWLENEQKPVAPQGFETTVAPTPLLDGAAKPYDCTRIEASESYIVPSQAKNVPGGLAFLQIMCSKDAAAKFTELTASPTVVMGATEGMTLTPGAESATALSESGGDENWNYYYDKWYTPMQPKIESAIAELAAGRLTADEFCSAAQQIADETADDPATKPRTRS